MVLSDSRVITYVIIYMAYGCSESEDFRGNTDDLPRAGDTETSANDTGPCAACGAVWSIDVDDEEQITSTSGVTRLALLGDVDLNGDGATEIVVGDPGAYNGDGRLRVLFRGVDIGDDLVGDGGVGLGAAIADAGTLSGDGYHDLIVGMPDVDGGGATILLGPFADGGFDDTFRVIPNGDSVELGAVVAGGQSLDDEGLHPVPDLLIADPGADDGAGDVWLLDGGALLDEAGRRGGDEMSLGALDAVQIRGAAGDSAGAAMAVGGLDAEGLGLLAIGAPGARDGDGLVYLISGDVAQDGITDDGMLADLAWATLSVSEAEARSMSQPIGRAIAVVGEADGEALIALGTTGLMSSLGATVGGVLIYASNDQEDHTSWLPTSRLEGDDRDWPMGASVSFPGDINGDGAVDLAVGTGAPSDERSEIGGWVLTDLAGVAGGSATLREAGGVALTGASDGAWQVAAAGYQAPDGYPDLLIGRPGSGDVRIVFGMSALGYTP